MLNITFALIFFLNLFTSLFAATSYNFGQLYFWPYEEEGCNNTKDKFLAKTSSIRAVSRSIKGRYECNVVGGRWVDYFTGEELNDAREITVAPIVPLLHLKRLGVNWDLSKMINYVHDESNLIIFKKGSQSEAAYLTNIQQVKYMPKPEVNQCEFLGRWMDTKINWNIPFLSGEKEDVSQAALDCLARIRFNRQDTFGPWLVAPGNACPTRVEVLNRDSYVTTTRAGEEIAASGQCANIVSGKWFDPYTGNTFTTAKELDIDHVVPLKQTYEVGAWKWPDWKRKEYANYQENPFHLIAVDLRENRSKGSRHPGEYMPPNRAYHCEYVENWIGIKLRWGLPMVSSESQFLLSFIKSCHGLDVPKYTAIIQMLSTQ